MIIRYDKKKSMFAQGPQGCLENHEKRGIGGGQKDANEQVMRC